MKKIFIIGGISFLLIASGVVYAADLYSQSKPENQVMFASMLTAFLTAGGMVLGNWIFTKVIKKDCDDCEPVNALVAAVAVLIEYNESVPQADKTHILTQLMKRGKK